MGLFACPILVRKGKLPKAVRQGLGRGPQHGEGAAMQVPFLKRALQVSEGTQSLSQCKKSTEDQKYCVSALRERTAGPTLLASRYLPCWQLTLALYGRVRGRTAIGILEKCLV